MVIIFMVFVWNITRFDLCFPDIGKPIPSSWLWLKAICQTIPAGRAETYLFSLCLVHPEIGDSGVQIALSGEWERLSPGMCRNLGILGTSRREKSTEVESDGRPLAWLSWLWEAFWEFSLRLLLRSSTTASLEEPMWSIDQTYLANKFVLIWLCLVEGNFRKKNIMFQWILNFSSVNWGLYLWKLMC